MSCHSNSGFIELSMKAKCFFVFLFFAVATSTYSQTFIKGNFLGHWWLGMLEEAQLPINLTFERTIDANSDVVPVLYSPLQSSDPIPASKWSFSGDTLRFSNKTLSLKLDLVWNAADSTFSGTFRQGLMRAAMLFSPSAGIYRIHRPQTPQPPFPYSEREVVITRKKADVVLTGTLTLPQGEGPFPAVVLVSGSGQQNRDEELLGHKPFLVIADHLARAGVAVLRYDDRGVGGSKGDVANATSLDFADDAEAVFDFLRKQPYIRRNCVGIVGHSEGALIASIVASHNRKVSFIVLLAGQSCSGAEILLQQNQALYASKGVPQNLIDIRLKCLESMFSIVDTAAPQRVESLCRQTADNLCESLSSSDRKTIDMRRADVIMLSSQLQIPWMKAFLKIDNRDYLPRVKCPVLALCGEKDIQVPPSNLAGIKKMAAGRTETVLLPELNHLMQHCASGSPSEYFLIEETFAPEALSMLSSWILKISNM